MESSGAVLYAPPVTLINSCDSEEEEEVVPSKRKRSAIIPPTSRWSSAAVTNQHTYQAAFYTMEDLINFAGTPSVIRQFFDSKGKHTYVILFYNITESNATRAGIAANFPIYKAMAPFQTLGDTATKEMLAVNADPTTLIPGEIVHVPREASTYLHEAKVIDYLPRMKAVLVEYTTPL